MEIHSDVEFKGNVTVKSLPSSDNSDKPASTKWVKENIKSKYIGELFYSLLPISDTSVHLLDGSVISEQSFVEYISSIYQNTGVFQNVNVIGSLTQDNYTLSGFSIQNYADTPNKFSPGNNPWEMNFKIRTPITTWGDSTFEGAAIINGPLSGSPVEWFVYPNSCTLYLAFSDKTGTYKTITRNFNLNTLYWMRLKFTGSQYQMYLSTNGSTYELLGSIDSTKQVLGGYPIRLGANPSTADAAIMSSVNVFLGSYDLSECYININNNRWWSGMSSSVFCSEEEFQGSVGLYGACGKFVYNENEKTVRLPKISGFIEGTLDASKLGGLVEAGLPNITGAIESYNTPSFALNTGILNLGTGAFQGISKQSTHDAGIYEAVTTYTYKQEFDASRSSSIYGNSTTVQPQSVNAFAYIVISN